MPRLKFLSTHTRRRRHQGYDISSPDIRPGSHKIMVHGKGLVTRNTHVQYESISSGKKVMAKVKVYQK